MFSNSYPNVSIFNSQYLQKLLLARLFNLFIQQQSHPKSFHRWPSSTYQRMFKHHNVLGKRSTIWVHFTMVLGNISQYIRIYLTLLLGNIQQCFIVNCTTILENTSQCFRWAFRNDSWYIPQHFGENYSILYSGAFHKMFERTFLNDSWFILQCFLGNMQGYIPLCSRTYSTIP